MVGIGRTRRNKVVALICICFIGCAQETVYDNPASEIKLLEQHILEAQNDQVDILSPYNFAHAKNSLDEAKVSQTSKAIEQSEKYLKAALSTAQTAHYNIEDVIQARQAARQVKADLLFPDDFADADRELRRTCYDLESQELDPAVNRRARMLQIIAISRDERKHRIRNRISSSSRILDEPT